MPFQPEITRAAPRQRVQARFPDGRVFEAPVGTSLRDLLRAAARDDPPGPDAVAAVVDGRLRELSFVLEADAEVRPVGLRDVDGVRIYRRSLVFLLVTATKELFPDACVFVEHSATAAAGYYCTVRGRSIFETQDLERIEGRMREIVAEDAPFSRSMAEVKDAVALFRARGEDDTARLLGHRAKGPVPLYTLRGRAHYSHGYLVPSAGYLPLFALRALPYGFMLQFPHQHEPLRIPALSPYPRLFGVFQEAGDWLNRLGVRCAGALNDTIEAGRLPEVSLVAEALHEGRIAAIAGEIAARQVRVVLVAGPSSSGKTTFAKRLAIQLLAMGRHPFPIGLDDYFLDREDTPKDEHGHYDFEQIGAVDLALVESHLLALLEGRTVDLPRYDFRAGRRQPGRAATLHPEDVLIVEGIHGLNPLLLSGLPSERLYRVYVSALTQLNLDRHNRVSTTDCRLIRRVVRDTRTRGYTTKETITRWTSVSRGEKRNIFPFQENADAIFNSSLVHELSVLRPLAEPLLLQIRPDTPEFVEANRLLSFLQWFPPAGAEVVPGNSILREFIGGSILDGFRLWPSHQTGPPTAAWREVDALPR
jgi:uridine kinase